MINGVEALISVEQKLEAGTDIKEAMGEHADLLDHAEEKKLKNQDSQSGLTNINVLLRNT